ncbi:unnamed protein product [Symbiodinium necroappetens]|uniref:Uncharacterized protein n=1 Tax=Symbiodinium necroappetens TaxID=1628268 RepID=A0A812JVT1_9DINO|nr:unnamed protein product [Symbiodinium necroappetens]
MSMGLYEEYQKFRAGNAQWRRGLAGGARGELTAEALSTEERRTRTFIQSFFPSFEAWHWRRTASYWIAIFFTEGSLLFVLGSCFGYAGDSGWRASSSAHVNAHLVKALSIWPSLFGSAFFSCGAILMCLETMNVMRPVGSWTFRIFSFKSIFAACRDWTPAGDVKPRSGSFWWIGRTLYFHVLSVVLPQSSGSRTPKG